MKILYIDGVGPLGGSSRSLFEIVRVMKENKSVTPYFLRAAGSASIYYDQIAAATITTRGLTRFDNTEYSQYKGVRWLVLMRELSYIPFTILAITKAKIRWKNFAAIHVNEITEIVPGIFAKIVFGAPLVVHVRSAQSKQTRSFRSRIIGWALKRFADSVIAIDETVRSTLPKDISVSVIHNSFTKQDSQTPDRKMIKALESLPQKTLKVGFVGNLHVSKGVFDLLEAARLVSKSGHAVQYVLVGGNTRTDHGLKQSLLRATGLAQNRDTELAEQISDYEMDDVFHLMGPTRDIQSVYSRIDVLCFPSHFDAPGRPIFEAAFFGVPCITCVSDPQKDTFIPGETGLNAKARDPEDLAKAIIHFVDRPDERDRMGENARALANANFDPSKNAEKVQSIYLQVARPKKKF